MLNGKRICVVMPAYNAEKTLKKTYDEIPKDIVDNVILTDDASTDKTVKVSRELDIKTFIHTENKGYGGNQKTCYQAALESGADIVIMLHPDYQYTPKLILPMASMMTEGLFDAVIGSRILGNKAMMGGMPLYKYVSNRILTLSQNLLIQQKLSEYHTGYRAFSRKLLETIPFWKTPMISCSTTRCFARPCISVLMSGKYPARRSILTMPHPSVSAVA